MVANAIIGGLGAIGAIASLFGNSGGSSALLSESANKRLMQYQYDLNRKTRQTSYQDTRSDLESAGYNPLLAVGQQSNGGSFGSSMSVQDPKFERMQNMLSALGTLSQNHLNSSQAVLNNRNGIATLQNALNNTNQTNAQVGLLNSQTQAQNLQNNITSAYGMAQAFHTIQNLMSSTSNNYAQATLSRAQVPVAKALTNMYTQSANLINAQTQGQNNSNVISARQAQWVQKHPKLSGFGIGMQNVGVPLATSAVSAVGAGKMISSMMPVPHNPVGFHP